MTAAYRRLETRPDVETRSTTPVQGRREASGPSAMLARRALLAANGLWLWSGVVNTPRRAELPAWPRRAA